MFFRKIKFSHIAIFFSAAFVYGMFSFTGCGSDSTPTTVTPAADTNIVSYDSIDVFPSAVNGLDLFSGTSVVSTDHKCDLSVVGTSSFYFQSGNLTGGTQTGLAFVDSTHTKATFKAMSSVSGWGTTIDSTMFSSSSTQGFGTVSGTTVNFPIYGFYLKGKFAAGGTGSNRVYGILHVNSVNTGGLVAKINVSVKINKAGQNKF